MFAMFLFRNEKKDIEGQLPSKVVEFVSKPLVRSFLGWYEGILVFCRAIAVSLDPLFFYVPVINEDKKCIRLNKVLWTIAIVSRSVTDFIYLVHYVVKSVVKSKKSKIRKEHNDESNSKERNRRVKSRSYFWPFFMLNILVILPIPQVKETLATFSVGNYYFHVFSSNLELTKKIFIKTLFCPFHSTSMNLYF